MLFTIPLTNAPQQFSTQLNGRQIIIVSKYNDAMSAWVLDILDGNTEETLITALPLVAGADLLWPFQHILEGELFVYTDGDINADPTLENLGQSARLYYAI